MTANMDPDIREALQSARDPGMENTAADEPAPAPFTIAIPWGYSPFPMPITPGRLEWSWWMARTLAWGAWMVLRRNWDTIRANPLKALLAMAGCMGATLLCPYFGAMAVGGCLAYGARPQKPV